MIHRLTEVTHCSRGDQELVTVPEVENKLIPRVVLPVSSER